MPPNAPLTQAPSSPSGILPCLLMASSSLASTRRAASGVSSTAALPPTGHAEDRHVGVGLGALSAAPSPCAREASPPRRPSTAAPHSTSTQYLHRAVPAGKDAAFPLNAA